MKRPIPAALILVLTWTIWRLVFLLHTGTPQPEIHDEFSYLLGADTFSHGHLANPSPPLSEFFESPHILVRPTYASKYPPGQALFLAAGMAFFGSPFFGVILSNAFMLFSLCLMLFAWVRPMWAIIISVLFALYLHPGMYWTDSYWGGSVAASGGALVLLSIGISRQKQTPLGGALFACGALLLFWTRPYEGGVFTLSILIVFARQIWRNRALGALLTAACIFVAGGIFTCCQNRAVTGNPFQMPYLLHDREYNTVPIFWFLPTRAEPLYTHPRLAAQHGTLGWEAMYYNLYAQHRWPLITGLKLTINSLDWPLVLALSLVIAFPMHGATPFPKMAIIIAIFLVALSIETFHFEHYAAPAWGAFALAIAVWAERVVSAERAYSRRIGKKPLGLILVLAALGEPAILQLAVQTPQLWKNSVRTSSGDDSNEQDQDNWPRDRAALIERLSTSERPQLVIVRYPSPDWNVGEEWVYNGADIDHQRVIFAHDLGPRRIRLCCATTPTAPLFY